MYVHNKRSVKEQGERPRREIQSLWSEKQMEVVPPALHKYKKHIIEKILRDSLIREYIFINKCIST